MAIPGRSGEGGIRHLFMMETYFSLKTLEE